MDFIDQPGVDIVHDIESIPWPITAGTVENINASHVMEHMKPWKLFPVMDEAWRVMKVDGELTIRTPYGPEYDFDPTHCILFQESSFLYFDPEFEYYKISRPKPWQIIKMERDEENHQLLTILKKRAL